MKISRLTLNGVAAELAVQVRALTSAPGSVADAVAETLAAVSNRGDAALLELSERFDGVRPAALRIKRDEIESGADAADPSVVEALSTAAENIRAIAEAQLVEDPPAIALPQGQTVSLRSVAVEAAGIYVPGGSASYPSSVLMGALPAGVAGVGRICVATPPSVDGAVDPNVLAACEIAGVDDVYPVGGAQAIAALAFGTETIDPVDVIAGPGSTWVQEAKLQVSRQVGIDSYAGPSELMLIFDETAPIDWLALDLCAQAEHGAAGLLVAVASEPELLDRLSDAVSLSTAQRPSVAGPSLALVEAADVDSAIELADAIAPEHLQIACEAAAEYAAGVRIASCVLVGSAAATAFGDYAAGSNHVLPTGGAARFSGPLGPGTFRRTMSIVDISPAAAAELAAPVAVLADAEGFPVHGESVRARVGSPRPTGVVGKMGEA